MRLGHVTDGECLAYARWRRVSTGRYQHGDYVAEQVGRDRWEVTHCDAKVGAPAKVGAAASFLAAKVVAEEHRILLLGGWKLDENREEEA